MTRPVTDSSGVLTSLVDTDRDPQIDPGGGAPPPTNISNIGLVLRSASISIPFPIITNPSSESASDDPDEGTAAGTVTNEVVDICRDCAGSLSIAIRGPAMLSMQI